MTSPAEVGFFSFVEVTDPGEHRSYNEWHQLDHLPAQYVLPGIARGDRWVLSPACRSVAVAVEPVHYVALYLMTEPLGPTLTDFAALGRSLAEVGRFHQFRRSRRFGAWDVTSMAVAPRVLVDAAVLPFRPATGAYVIAGAPQDVGALIEVPGVAGAWSFSASSRFANNSWIRDTADITVCWLDGPPVSVGAALAPRVAGAPVFAAPLETITVGEWEWFA